MRSLKKSKFLAAILAVCLLVTTLSAVIPLYAAASPVIVSMTDLRTAEKGLNMFASGYNGEYVGVYQFNSTEKALEVSYSTNQKEYRFCIRMKNKEILAENQSWMVVTYKTDMTAKGEMKLNNCNNSAVMLDADVSRSAGKWVRTEAVNINDASLGATNYFARLRGDMWDFIEVESTDTKSKVYIGEIAFFGSKAEADEYYKDKPLNEDGAEKDTDRIMKREENWETIKLIMSLIGRKLYMKDIAVLDGPFEDIDPSRYTHIRFYEDSFKNKTLTMNTVGATAQFAVHDGVKAVKFAPANVSWLNNSRFNFSFKLTAPNLIEKDDCKYYVITYSSVSKADYTISLWTANDKHPNDPLYLKVADVPAGVRNRGVSDILPVTECMEYRFNSAQNLAFISDCVDSDAEIYISSITFFQSKAAAEKYVKQYNQFYNVKNSGMNTSRYTEIRLNKDTFGSFNMINMGSIPVKAATVTYNGVDAVRLGATASPVTWLDNCTYSVAFNMKSANSVEEDDFAYMVLRYASSSEVAHTIKLWPTSDGNVYCNVADVPAGMTNWTLSEIVAVPAGIMQRVNNGENLAFISSCSDPNAEIYIAGVTFFENMKTAEMYVKEFGEQNDYADITVAPDKYTYMPLNSKNFAASGQFEVVTVNTAATFADYDGINAMKMASVAVSWHNNSKFNCSFKARAANQIEANDRKYYVVTYASVSSVPYTLQLWSVNSANANDPVYNNVADVPAGTVGWTASAALPVTDSIAQRFSTINNIGFLTNCTDASAEIYIGSITFFEDIDSANAFIKIFNASY